MEYPSLVRIFIDGGPVMLLALLWFLVWIAVCVLYRVKGLKSSCCVGILFPLGFGLLAILNWVFGWHVFNKRLLIDGFVDPLMYANESLRISRSTLMICGAAGVSFCVEGLKICRAAISQARVNPRID